MIPASNFESSCNFFLELIKKSPGERLQKLFHCIVDIYCGQKDFYYDSYSDVYSLCEWWDLIDQSKIFLKNCHNWDNTASILQLLPATHSEVIKDILSIRYSDLRNELIEKTHAVSPAYLRSFDWKLMLTLASDKMSQINEPRLLLDLDVSGNKDKVLQLDLGKDELKSLIDKMERIKIVITDLKTAECINI